jgi:ribosome recycling factor
MSEELSFIIEATTEDMKKAVDHLDVELLKVRAGRASPALLESVRVDYYGAMTPLNQIANVSTPDAKTITIQAFEKKMLEGICKAITNSNLGLNPQNNGDIVIISVPSLTEERRRDLVKKAKSEAETAKVSIRSLRKEANDEIKKLQKAGLPEDMAKDGEAKIQKMTDDFIRKADDKVNAKEKDIMTI